MKRQAIQSKPQSKRGGGMGSINDPVSLASVMLVAEKTLLGGPMSLAGDTGMLKAAAGLLTSKNA